ncbi:GAF domain-containing sensor histidine kinase [Halomonas sp. BC1]|uniref:GAF domain-containing sensor histidine kinase n=1 Tax=Halomonas sp. BC1 TaxID=1670448 RepID=UPI0009BE2309|nr:GAF domain-containing sensor histidine kinase [Halomonas sp. BC1]
MGESERARLQALHGLALLDTPPEERFDRFTRLAIQLFGVDIALVSLVDEERQWFKSRQGLALTQTCREESFCAHAIQTDGIFEVADASLDPRFRQNVLVTTRGGIRFYAGVPLTTSSGFRVGTLCIIHPEPRRLSLVERQALIDLAACVEEEINRKAMEQELAAIRRARERLQQAEQEQRRMVSALTALNEISTSSALSLSEQLNASLALGCDYLGMQIGIVSRIEQGVFEVVAVQAPQHVPLSSGQCLPLANTYCDMTLAQPGVLTIEHAGQSSARHHPCYNAFGFEAYIGSAIHLSEQVFGTVSFSSAAPRAQAFAKTDELFLKLLSRWIGATLDRQRVEAMKSEFVSTVSHELRTPLTAMTGSIKLVMAGATGALPQHTQQMLALALKNGERLARLINDLLDIDKLLAGKLHFVCQPQPLSVLLNAAVDENRSCAAEYDVTLVVEPLMQEHWIKVDTLRFQQVMTHLLSNAAKFSLSGGRVTIFCEEHDKNVRINVQDTGCGIPDDFKPRVFQKFSQADSSDRRVKGGTGLGLSICKAITEHMGGSIGFTSHQGQGSTFYISFPWVEEQGRALH